MSLNIVNILIIGLAILLTSGVVLLSLANIALGDEMSERMETYALVPEDVPRRSGGRRRVGLARMRLRLNAALSRLTSEELGHRLTSANWPITETEYILIRFWIVAAGLALGWLILRSPISGVGFAVIGYLVPGVYLRNSIHRRRMRFEKQLIDVLVLITGAVRSGYSFLQSLDVVVKEMPPPVSEEFRRVRREVGLGLPLSQALGNLNTRMQNDDLALLVTAVNINTQVGGNLSVMLDAVTNTIRERIRLLAEVRAITSMQRYSGYLLTLLPFGTAAILFILNPEYMARLFEPGITLCIPIGAIILVILGNIVIRFLAKIDV